MIPYKYAYLLADVTILFPIWLILYLYRKDLRKELFATSLLFGLVAPVSEIIYLKTYWHPQTFLPLFYLYRQPVPYLEDFLFGFFVGGMASVIYEEVYGKKISRRRDRTHHWTWFIPPLLGLSLLILIFAIKFFSLNAVYANILIFAAATLVMLFFRNDLWMDSLMSGLMLSLLMLFVYALVLGFFPQLINRWWYLQNLSGILLFGIPLEEFLWAFGMGMMAGPLYEFMMGLKFKKSG